MKTKLWLQNKQWVGSLFSLILAFAATSFGMAAQGAGLQIVRAKQPWLAANLAPINSLSETNRLNLAIALPLRNQAALSDLLRQIYDPASPNFHHYLTPEQFTEQFGPSQSDYQSVIAYAASNGFQVTATHANRLLLDVSAPVPVIERALHLKMHVYRHPTENRTFYAPDTEPTLDLAVPIVGISGLDDYALPHPRLVIQSLDNGQNNASNAGSGPSGTYMGHDFRAAYVPDTTLTGSGQTVGLLQFDGYTSNDIAYYEQRNSLPAVTLTNVLLDGFTGYPTGSGGEVEVSLDIEMSISMAPGLSKIIVYEAGPYGNWQDILNRMATDNLAKQLSCSWYIPNGGSDPVADGIWQEMAMQGQSFLNASGDDDAYTGLVPFPGDSPYITQVGGTTLSTTGPGGPWTSETVWNWGHGIGSGGGISTQYPIQSWQTNVSMASNQGSTTMRNIPDVALTADNVYVRADGRDEDVGGTSCAAPLWAGFTALVNQEATASGHSTVGFLNPLVYAIGAKAAYATDFHDTATGNNESSSSPNKFSAVTGYDLCTGWGTPAGQKLIDALANPEPLIITPATGFFSIGGTSGPFTVTYQTFTLTNSGTNSLSWTLSNTSSWLNVSSTSGTLAAAGPATNVVVSLNTVASNLSLGIYTATLAFTNLNDQIGQYRQFTLDIISPPTITLQPTNQAVLDGENAAFSAQTSGGVPQYYQWQLDGTNLTDGDGIVGSLTTNLTVTAASVADVGTYTLIVSNAAGITVSSNAMLSLVDSAPVITLQPTNVTTGENSTAQFSVAAIGTKPISYQWTFNTTNEIAGATNATLTLPDVQFTNAGNYAVTLTNIYGSTNSEVASLTVTPCDPTPSGIVSWWAAEGNAYDQISGNNGTLSGAVSYIPGEVGQAFQFNASQAMVLLGNPTNLWLQNFTIECWIKRSSSTISSLNSSEADLFNAGLDGYGFGINGDGSMFLTQVGVGNVTLGLGLTDTNNWHHVAVTKNGSTVVFYIDGVAYPAPGYNPTFQFNATFALGGRGDALINSFYGGIDEMSVYNRALSATEIQDIYIAGSGGKCFTPVAPTITGQPTNSTVYVGQTAAFSVSASGTPPLSYQWAFDTTNIAGATNAILSLPDVQFTNAGNYAVIVSNSVNSVLSSNAVLTVNPPPPCDPTPSGIVAWWAGEGNAYDQISGDNGTLNGAVSYIPGEVGQAFQFNASQAMVLLGNPTNLWLQNFTIECWIKRSSSTISSLNSSEADLFNAGLDGYGFGINGDGSMFLTQVGVGNVTLGLGLTDTNNWHHVAVTKNGSTVVFYIDGVAYPAPGYNPTFQFNATFALGGRGDALINSFYGGIDEMSVYNRALSATEIQDIYIAGSGGKCFTPVAPTITGQPTNSTVYVGQTAAFSVSASGTPPLSYQWAFDTTNIAGATNAILSLPDVQFTNAGNYAVIVSNSVNSVLSSNAVLTVNPPPPCDPTPSGIVAWWAGEGNAYDQISGDNGTLNGAVSYIPGEVGQAFQFNASQAMVLLGNPTNLWLQNFTIECWIKRSSSTISSLNSSEADLFNAGLDGYGFGINGDGSMFLTQVGVGNVTLGLGLTDTNNWHHVAVTKNGSTVVFYIDGVAYPAPGYNPTFQFNATFALGGRGDALINSFYGGIDEMSVYNRALASNEIAAIYNVGTGGKCFNPTPPVITHQPTNQTVNLGQTTSFSVVATNTFPLSYQWTFNSTNMPGATHSSLTLTNIQFTNAGTYAVIVNTPFISIASSNALLSVKDILSYFTWTAIPSPQFVNMPFSATIQAMGTTNEVLTNFTGTVSLKSTNGIPVNPPVTTNFVQGTWTGNITISQPTNNLVLLATNSAGPIGYANPFNIFTQPSLGYTLSGSYLLMFWPVIPTNFVMETSPDLINWTPLGIPPLQIGDENLESIQISAGTNQYYRLQFGN